MRILCLCHDAAGASKRTELFEAHTVHNLAHLAAFCLTGPIASADGSSGVGDDPRLCGSLYCLDVPALADARAIMEADPFMQGAWSRIDYYDWAAATGVWDDPAQRPFGLDADYRCYIAFSAEPAGEALMAGPAVLLDSTGQIANPIASVAVLRADDMAAAVARAPGAERVVAMPIAIGRWAGIASMAALADYRARMAL